MRARINTILKVIYVRNFWVPPFGIDVRFQKLSGKRLTFRTEKCSSLVTKPTWKQRLILFWSISKYFDFASKYFKNISIGLLSWKKYFDRAVELKKIFQFWFCQKFMLFTFSYVNPWKFTLLYIILCYIILYYIILYCIILYCIVLCCSVLYFALSYYIVLYCIMSYHMI